MMLVQLRWDGLWLGYTECWGLPLLRQQVAATFYPGLEGDSIRMFAGAEVSASTPVVEADLTQLR